METKKILVVEDEIIVALSIQDMLEGWGYRVLEIAPSGEDAIRSAEEFKPDLILMDVKLKGSINGIEAMKTIRARTDVPVIFTSGQADDDIREKANGLESFSILAKPVSPYALKDKILRMLADNPD